MEKIQGWFQQKLRRSMRQEETRPGSPIKRPSDQRIVTPFNIPAFTIPKGKDLVRSSSSTPKLDHRVSGRSSAESSNSPSPILGQGHGRRRVNSDDELQWNTNADSSATAAMSVAHVRTSTPYGFTTMKLRSSSQTRESLFQEELVAARMRKTATISYSPRSPMLSRHLTIEATPVHRSSSFHCLSAHLLSPVQMLSVTPTGSRTSLDSSKFFSLPTPKLWSEDAVPRGSPAPSEKSDDSGKDAEEANDVLSDQDGTISITLEASEQASTLDANIGLQFSLPHEETIFLYFKVTLFYPRSRSVTPVRRIQSTQESKIDEKVQFTNLKMRDFADKALQIKLYRKMTKWLHKDKLLAHLVIKLGEFDLREKQEIRRSLFPTAKNGAEMCAAAKFEPDSNRVRMVIKEIRGMNDSGARMPDSYVSIKSFNEFGCVQTMKSPLLFGMRHHSKASNSPQISPSFDIAINPRPESLQHFYVEVGIYRKKKIKSDILIGTTLLGETSADPMAKDFWSTVLSKPYLTVSSYLKLQ